PFGCRHTSPKVSALRTPLHFATGCGGFHRRSPTGGAANGIPLKTRTPRLVVPEINPDSSVTGSGIDAETGNTAITRVTTSTLNRAVMASAHPSASSGPPE